MSTSSPKSVLLLAANPTGTVNLRLQEEEREIKERLRLAGYGKIPINSTGATRPRDIQQAMLDFEPQIVHFSGHGTGESGLSFEDIAGQEKLVDSKALTDLFRLFSSQIECIVLNACHSKFQAEAISEHIDYVIGMSQSIGDRAAIEFSIGFYSAIGTGKPFEFAYELGCNAIQLEGIQGHQIPTLYKKKSIYPKGSEKQAIVENQDVIASTEATSAISETESDHTHLSTVESLRGYIVRLVRACLDLSSGGKSSDFIANAGLSIINSHLNVLSILMTFVAVPVFISLYYTERWKVCRFTPTCKVYLIQAIEIHGPIKGLALGISRVARCNPRGSSGDDPVPCVHEKA